MAAESIREPLVVDDTQRDIFPFFELARELRDAIYDECVHSWKTASNEEEPELSATGLPCPNLLRVSRQFASEYESRIRGQGILTITDDDKSLCPEMARVPEILRRNVRLLKLNLWCGSAADLAGHEPWVEKMLAQMRKSPIVHITLVCNAHRVSVSYLPQVNNSRFWRNITNLASLEVYEGLSYCVLARVWDGSAQVSHLGSWNKETGKVEVVEDFEN